MLGVFPAVFGIAAAAAVLDTGDGQGTVRLANLVDHNLLVRVRGRSGEDRFRMLESVREFAHDQLAASNNFVTARQRLLEWCVAFAEEAARQLDGPSPVGWWDQLTDELPAIRASLDWALASGEVEAGLRLSTAMRGFWLMGGDFREGQHLLEQALTRADDLAPAIEVRACLAAIDVPRRKGEIEHARKYCERAVARARAANDPALLCEALSSLPDLWAYSGYFADARQQGEEAVAWCREADSPLRIGWICHALALVAVREGDTTRALAMFDHAQASFEAARHALGLPWVMTGSAFALISAGVITESAQRYGDALRLHLAYMSVTGIGVCLGQLAWIAALRGQPAIAARLCATVHSISLHAGWALTSPEGSSLSFT
jgi:tetratricopeptide (TPR) repeat protein